MFGRSFTFRALLASAMLILVVLAVGGILAISIFFTSRAVNDLTGQIVAQRLQTIDDRIQSLMQAAVDQNDLNTRLTTSDTLSSADFHSLFPFVSRSFETQKQLSSLGLVLEKTGEYCMIERMPDGQVRFQDSVQDASGARVLRLYSLHGTELVLDKTLPSDDFDPRTRPYYQNAKKFGRSGWTETYAIRHNDPDATLPGATYATPIYDSHHQLLGMWDADFDTRTLCQFLKVLDDDFSGYSVAMHRRRDGNLHLVAHPDIQVLIDAREGQLDQGNGPQDDHIVRDLMLRLANDHRPSGQIDLRTDGTDYITAWSAIGNNDMPRWLVVTILPRNDIMKDILASRRWGLSLLGGLIILVTWLAFRFASRIARRLDQLQVEARKIGLLQLDPGQQDHTGVLEFDHLSQAIEEMKTNLRSFRKYVPTELVRDLVQSGKEADLGGSTRVVSIYFSDIANFTSTAENLAPSVLVDHLATYLGAMSAGVARHEGTVDKFIGDSVMAFWNAPQENPDHALDACRAALENLRQLETLQAQWKLDGQPLFHTRIGLHTGEVVVGNIGSEVRMNYTIIGDAVNLTSRLQNLNKLYGTRILMSGKMVALVGDEIVVRPVDRVSPKGRRGGDAIYELVGLRSEVSEIWLTRCRRTAEAWELYLNRDFSAAAAIYREIITAGDTSVSIVLHDRCQKYLQTPPPESWDGTLNIE